MKTVRFFGDLQWLSIPMNRFTSSLFFGHWLVCTQHFCKVAKVPVLGPVWLVKYENPNRNEAELILAILWGNGYCYFCCYDGGNGVVIRPHRWCGGETENVICLCQNWNYSTLHMNLISFRWNEMKRKSRPEHPEIHANRAHSLSLVTFICYT